MSESILIIDSLKKLMKLKGVSYLELAQSIGLSEASIKRIFSENTFTLDRLEKICNYLEVSIHDLAAMASVQSKEDVYTYTLEQEEFFCSNLPCLAFFDLLIRLKTVKAIQSKFKISDKKVSFYLKPLEELGLIERMPYDKIKFLVSRNVSWNVNGPLRSKLLSLAKNEFLDSNFEDNSYFSFQTLQLSTTTYKKFMLKLGDLAKEASKDSELERNAGIKLEDYGAILCTRPWRFSVLEQV